MASRQTQTYKLNQWDAEDAVLRTDFNADNQKIESALAGLAQSKADASALTSLAATVAQKGNCQIVTGQYTGSGLKGSNAPNRLSFTKRPVFLIVCGGELMIAARGCNGAYVLHNGTSDRIVAEWGDKTVAWYTNHTDDTAYGQMNASGTVYTYFALMEA